MSPFTRPISLILLCLTFFVHQAFSQIHRWPAPKKGQSIDVVQWTVYDVTFQAKGVKGNLFDKQADALVLHEGKTQKIPLFYNGNDEWILRFSASQPGTYTYTITSEIPALANQKGQFRAVANTKPNRHGGVVLNPANQTRFYYEDGTPYFNLAFECDWLFALDYGKADLAKTKHLLNLLEKNGLNQVVMNVYSHDVSWKKDSLLATHPEHEYGGRQAIFPFLGSNKSPDHGALNPAFFQHLDKVLAEMHDRELVSHLMIYVWNKLVAWPDMNTPDDNRYFDYVVKRYQAFPNVIWDVSKEALYYGRATEGYISERINRIREQDAYHRLVSVHDFGFCTKHPDEVDFVSSQNWSHTLYQHMLEASTKFKNKPVFNIEHGGYEESPYHVFPGAYTDAEVCLRRNYMCLFAGVYTTYYWQGTSWNAVIHNPDEQPAGFYKPHFDYFAHLSQFFQQYPFEKFKPHPWQNTNGYNLTNEQDGTVLMYMPKENYAVTLEFLNKEKTPPATMQWFNTLTGEYTRVEKFNMDRASHSPWTKKADTILIITKK